MSDICAVCGDLIDDMMFMDTETRNRVCWGCKHELDSDYLAQVIEDEEFNEALEQHDSVDSVLQVMDDDAILTYLAEQQRKEEE